MYIHNICAYTAGQFKVDEVNVVPIGKIFLCVVLCGICTCYVVVYTYECLYVHMCVRVCMHTHGCRSQRLTRGVFPQLFFPLFETRSITKPESMQLCQQATEHHGFSWLFLSIAGLQATVFSQVIHKGGMMFTLYSQLQKHSCQSRASPVTACPIGEKEGKQSFSWAKKPETLPQSSVTLREQSRVVEPSLGLRSCSYHLLVS